MGAAGRGSSRSSTAVFPKRSRAPGARRDSRTRVSFTQVPLRLSRSTSHRASPRRSKSACIDETQGSAIWIWHSADRPSTVGTSGRKNTVPPQIPFTTKSSATRGSLNQVPLPRMPVCPTCRTPSEEGVLICPVDGTRLTQGGGLVGRTLGDRYRILERIGEGGMGTVYLCEHVALGKRMAVKVLRPEFSSDEELVRRFQQEARAASQIGQENIVDVIDFGRTPDGSMYFAMEALEGESLAKVMRREGKLPLDRAFPILGQICKALGAAHARGIVHRDLKPENVILLRRDDGSDFVKVLDFGISKNGRGPETARITRAGSIIGTPEYMAPEQAAATTVDHRCDIYALGVLAYEMVTGVLPFQGDTPLATLLKHQSEPPESPRKRRPDLPQEAETLILRALV